MKMPISGKCDSGKFWLYLAYGYKTIILPVVLYGCETWSLTLKEGV
jgi:hypothetical protein